MLLLIVLCVCLTMCLHPKIVNTDLLDRLIVHNNYCTFIDNCDYMSVDNKLMIDNCDFGILQLNNRVLGSKIGELKTLLMNPSKINLPMYDYFARHGKVKTLHMYLSLVITNLNVGKHIKKVEEYTSI